MSPVEETDSLAGKLLIAMPGMADPRFEHGIVLLCQHSDEGAMGLIVNKPAHDLSLGELLEKLDIASTGEAARNSVHFGGPVETARGFVLHSTDYDANTSTLDVCGRFGMTATLDILNDIAEGKGPDQIIVALGYAGWGPGQLESEIGGNGWLTCEATPELVFGMEDGRKWEAALKSLGIPALSLSATAGRA